LTETILNIILVEVSASPKKNVKNFTRNFRKADLRRVNLIKTNSRRINLKKGTRRQS